jgi:hypothetical protein
MQCLNIVCCTGVTVHSEAVVVPAPQVIGTWSFPTEIILLGQQCCHHAHAICAAPQATCSGQVWLQKLRSQHHALSLGVCKASCKAVNDAI